MAPQEEHNSFVLDALTCPITLELFVDPVLAEDGHTYERAAIVEWIKHHHGTSPLTRQPLKIKDLKSNRLVKQLADQYRNSLTSNISQVVLYFSGDGTLLNNEQKLAFNRLFSKEKRWSLIYKATRDGFGCDEFHRKCNSRGATLTLIQTRNRLYMKNRRILFGGYTEIPWSSRHGFHHDSQAFLFLFNQENLTRFNLRSKNQIAVSHSLTSGPIFGLDDIHIGSRANEQNSSYTRFPYSYEDRESNGKGQKTFSKSRNFLVGEIEVYMVIF